MSALTTNRAIHTPISGGEMLHAGEEPLLSWLSGKAGHVRNIEGTYQIEASDPIASGIMHMVTNTNLHRTYDGSLEGPMWGSYLTRNEELGGQWTGRFQGYIYKDGTFKLNAFGKGSGAFQSHEIHL